jgi:hypothetical protein
MLDVRSSKSALSLGIHVRADFNISNADDIHGSATQHHSTEVLTDHMPGIVEL